MSEDIDLSEFDDWLVDNFGKIAWGAGNTLTEHQKGIVARNVELILDRKSWTEKVGRFQADVDAHTDEDAKRAFLRRFAIHFDFASFNISDVKADFAHLTFPVDVSFYFANFIGGTAEFGRAEFGGDVNLAGPSSVVM